PCDSSDTLTLGGDGSTYIIWNQFGAHFYRLDPPYTNAVRSAGYLSIGTPSHIARSENGEGVIAFYPSLGALVHYRNDSSNVLSSDTCLIGSSDRPPDHLVGTTWGAIAVTTDGSGPILQPIVVDQAGALSARAKQIFTNYSTTIDADGTNIYLFSQD